jgi:hypothetical protein
MSSFEERHSLFLKEHLRKRQGERRGRLERGHGHGERTFLQNVWWPFRGDFSSLHPEYEVLDWRGRSYFADFAWLPGHVKLLIEIKGFASHVQNMDRQKYSNELNRETFLLAMGYQVVSFAYDDVEQRPELCISLLRMVSSRFVPQQGRTSKTQLIEKEAIRLAVQLARPIRASDLTNHLEIDVKTAFVLMQRLTEKGWITPVIKGKGLRIHKYELTRQAFDFLD